MKEAGRGESVKRMENIKVSVIVAIYNAEKYLKQCLESIQNQTLREIEILCVNDGSTDNSLEIVEKFAEKDARFHVFTKENEGLGGASARNYGLDKAQGTYISILDSDDFFEPDMLEKAYVKAEETEAEIVLFGGCEYDDKNGSFRKVASILNDAVVPEKEVFSYKDCKKDIYQLSQGMAWNKLYRRSFLAKYNLRFQRIKYTDDAYFTFAHMVLAKRIAAIKETLCYYRVNTGVSQTDGLANYPDSAYVPYVTLKTSLVEWGIYEEVQQSFMNCAVTFMRYFYDKISRFDAFKYLHEKYRNEIFKELDIEGQDKAWFYDARVYQWYRQVLENSAEDLAFQALRAYSGENTAILRFRFPYDKIPGGSRIAMVGAEIMGRQYYSQVMLTRYCDVVYWVSKENQANLSYLQGLEALRNADFEYVLLATAQKAVIDDVNGILKEINFPKDRIIIGGTEA